MFLFNFVQKDPHADPKNLGKKQTLSKDERPENDYSDVVPKPGSNPPIVPDRPKQLAHTTTQLLSKEWRILEWSKKKNTADFLRKFPISTQDVDKLRILVHGPVGAGKSSFINSIDSIFQGRITNMAAAEAATGHSFTRTFQTYHIKNQKYGSFLPFDLCDIMGLEDGRSEGVDTEDLIKVLQGHIEDGFKSHPNKISMMDDGVIDKMKHIRAKAGDERIPQVVILTKVDETCTNVAKDIKLIYKSQKIRDKMQECSNRLGVPMSYIFPVKCYHEEIHLNNEVDVLLLSALTFILNFANDHVAVIAPPAANMSGSSRQRYVNVSDSQQPPPR
ncbi:interferon-induced protein 44-like [Sardina pilchardus]|uniref:interferon-induced protein 44-like n=1 Tax=Sardina pilchardus TaxID=27697 RepID=UPI002E109A19